MTTYRRTLPGIQLVVFDLDGTLADTKRDLALSVNAMRELMGLGPLPLEAVTSYIGHGVTVLIKRALGDQAADGDVEKGLRFFLDYYARHLLDNTVAFPAPYNARAADEESNAAPPCPSSPPARANVTRILAVTSKNKSNVLQLAS